jgi:thiosulfate dehydrogenase [quinone] large subunit
MTIFGITAIGIGLFLGLFTRVACLGGIAFLAMTYLTIPPFPWLPVPPLNEGNYVFINKNMVEMFGMIVLFTTNSGRWFGLDAILANLLPSCCTWNSEPKS